MKSEKNGMNFNAKYKVFTSAIKLDDIQNKNEVRIGVMA